MERLIDIHWGSDDIERNSNIRYLNVSLYVIIFFLLRTRNTNACRSLFYDEEQASKKKKNNICFYFVREFF